MVIPAEIQLNLEIVLGGQGFSWKVTLKLLSDSNGELGCVLSKVSESLLET